MLGQLTAQFAIVRVPEHRGYRNLLLARLISALGTWTAFFAVRIAIYNQTGSAWWVSILLFCELVPSVILGIVIGPLIDRWPRQRMMILSDLGGAATFAVLPFVHSPAAICALSAVAGFSAAFFRPACYSAIPNLVREDSLVAANALVQGVENIATLIGPILAGVGVALLGSSTVYAPQRRQLPHLGDAAPADRQPAPVERAGPDRPHALARGSRRALARSQRSLPVLDRPDLELGDARLRRYQRGRDRAHDQRLRGREPGIRRVRGVLRRRHPARERRSRSGSSSG